MPYTFIDPFFCCANNYLKNVSLYETTPYVPSIKKGKVLKIMNGNTIVIAALLYGTVSPVYRFIISLKNVYRTDKKQMTKEYNSRRLLSDYLLGKMIHIKDLSCNEEGILNANIYLDDIHINKKIVDMGLGTTRQVSFSC
jgi:hypothetical protein